MNPPGSGESGARNAIGSESSRESRVGSFGAFRARATVRSAAGFFALGTEMIFAGAFAFIAAGRRLSQNGEALREAPFQGRPEVSRSPCSPPSQVPLIS